MKVYTVTIEGVLESATEKLDQIGWFTDVSGILGGNYQIWHCARLDHIPEQTQFSSGDVPRSRKPYNTVRSLSLNSIRVWTRGKRFITLSNAGLSDTWPVMSAWGRWTVDHYLGHVTNMKSREINRCENCRIVLGLEGCLTVCVCGDDIIGYSSVTSPNYTRLIYLPCHSSRQFTLWRLLIRYELELMDTSG